jgi:hypothetical protein
MRRLTLIAACLLASAGAVALAAPSQASAVTAPGLQDSAVHDNGLLLVRRGGGFRGGHGFRGRGFHGGRTFAFRGGHGFRGHAFRGGRVYAYRGGRHWGHRRVWRGRGWGWGWGAAAVAAPFYYGGYYGNCPLVRRTVWTPYGWRVRWVRRCW